MSTTVSLATITLQAFEVPSAISFGSQQRMAVHDMPGGGRVIDVLGGSSNEIAFEGILSGSTAEERAYLLEALCVSGVTVPLVWGQHYFMVVVAQADFDYQKSWWIPYRLRCVVITNLFNAALAATTSTASSILTSLTSAASFLDSVPGSITLAQASLTNPAATVPGSAAFATGMNNLKDAQGNLAASVTHSGAALPSFDLSLSNQPAETAAVGVVNTTGLAGSLASASAAAAYVGSGLSALSSLGA